MDMSNNAMSAKARAMYGRRLTDDDYVNLVNKNTISEVVSYLKNQTSYGSILANVNENRIRRRELEDLIRGDLFNRYIKLLKYDKDSNDFNKYLTTKEEINQILAVSRAIDLQDNKKVIADLPVYIISHMSFDLEKLAVSTNYDMFLDVLEGTDYADYVKRNLRDNRMNYVELETDLYNYYNKYIAKLIRRFDSNTRKSFSDIFDIQFELDNIARIYRMKRYMNAKPDEIRKYLIDIKKKINSKDLDNMIDNMDHQEFLTELSKGPYGKYFDVSKFMYIEHSIQEIMFHIHKHNIYFGSNANIVLLAYMNLCKTELLNIINIIEGIKYKINKEKISNMLIT